LTTAQNDYDNTLRKVITAKQNSENEKDKGEKTEKTEKSEKKANKLSQDLVECKKRLEKATKNYTEKVGQIQDAVRLQTLEQVCSYMYATHTYFLQGKCICRSYDKLELMISLSTGHRLLSSLEPTMRQLMNDIEQATCPDNL